MDRMRKIVGMGKAKVPSVVQKDKDESIVFFREMYKHEKDRDVNLLEPMYSVEFDVIQGGLASKVPSAKREFIIPVDEKHDYDWLKTPPAAPLFPSLEVEAHSSQMVFQKERPVLPRQVKSSASTLSGKPEATKTSAQPASATASSSSRRTFAKGTPAISREKKQPDTVGHRSNHKVLMNGQQKVAAAGIPAIRNGGATKKHSERCYASQTGGTNAAKGVADQESLFKAPKNLITTGFIFRRHTPSAEKARTVDVKYENGKAQTVDVKNENGKARRQSCPPAATRGMKEPQLEGRQNVLPPRGRNVGGGGCEPATNNGGPEGTRRANGKRT